MGLQTELEAEAEGPGSVLLPGRLLAELARSLGDDTVQLEVREAERDVEIRSGGSSFHLRVLPAEDFPKFPAEGEQPLKIPAAAMAETVDVVARAASRDDMRPVLTGVLVSASGEEMTMVATDSYRLAVKTTKLDPASAASSRRTSRRAPCASSAASSPPTASRRSRSACSPTRRSSGQGRSSSIRG